MKYRKAKSEFCWGAAMAWPDFLPPDDRDVYDELVRELQGARGFNQQARQDTLDTVRRAYIGSGERSDAKPFGGT